MNEPIDVTRYTRAESMSRLDYGPRYSRDDMPDYMTPRLGTHKTTWVV